MPISSERCAQASCSLTSDRPIDLTCGSAAMRGSTPTPRPAITMRHIASKLRTWMRRRNGRSSRLLSSSSRAASEVTCGRLTKSYSRVSA